MVPISLLTILFVPLLVRGDAADTILIPPPTNCTGAATDKAFDWWLSPETRSNPCQVLQLLFQQCDPNYQLPYMGPSAADAVDKCVAKREGVLAPCCCSTQAYALQQACWSCQNGGQAFPETDERPTLREYINCPRNIDGWQEVYEEIDMPPWACFGINLDDTWQLDQTKKLALKVGSVLAHKDGEDDDDDKNNNKSSSMTVASIVGSLCGLTALACALAVAHVIRRRRRRMFTSLQPHGKDRVPAWFGRNSAAYVSIDSGSQTYVDRYSKDMPSAPKPTLSRGRLSGAPSLISSWRRNVAKEPYLPRASTLESRDFGRSTTTVSMIRSETESRRSIDSDESFSNSQSRPPTVVSRATHAFSV